MRFDRRERQQKSLLFADYFLFNQRRLSKFINTIFTLNPPFLHASNDGIKRQILRPVSPESQWPVKDDKAGLLDQKDCFEITTCTENLPIRSVRNSLMRPEYQSFHKC